MEKEMTKQEILEAIKILNEVIKTNTGTWNDSPRKKRLREEARDKIEELIALL